MHGYLNAHEYASLWDEGEGDTFKADPPNAVLTWVDGDEMKEAELLIISAETVGHGRSIAYEVKVEAGETPVGIMGFASLFVDNWFVDAMSAVDEAIACRSAFCRSARGD